MAIRVTVEDTETGDKETTEIVNDYVLTTAGTCFAAGFQTYKNGTHVITIKGRKDK